MPITEQDFLDPVCEQNSTDFGVKLGLHVNFYNPQKAHYYVISRL